MRRQLTAALLLTVLLALFLGHLADSGNLLATRDIPVFHLPLRAALLDAAASGRMLRGTLAQGGREPGGLVETAPV